MEKLSTSASKTGLAQIIMLAHLIAIAVIALVLVWVLHLREGLAFTTQIKPKIFNVHPLLMVSFIVLVGEAIMVQKIHPAARKAQKTTHMVLHLFALITGIVGVYAVFKFHVEIHIPHIYSLHSWLGISAIGLFAIQWLFSLFAFVYPRLSSSSRAKLAPWHALGGMFTFLLAVSTSMIGLGEKFIFEKLQRGQEALVINFIGVLIILFALAVGAKVTLSRAYKSPKLVLPVTVEEPRYLSIKRVGTRSPKSYLPKFEFTL